MTTYRMGGKEGTAQSGDEGDLVSFSVRLPRALVEQIDARRNVNKRSRNKEVELLLERQIDSEVQRDLEIVKRIADGNATLKSNPS